MENEGKAEAGEVKLLEEGKVEVRILEEGKGEVPPPKSQVWVHFLGKMTSAEKGNVEPASIFYDTRKTPFKPFSFTLGEEQTIVGLEKAVSQLKEGTKAQIVVKSELGYGLHGNPHVCVTGFCFHLTATED
jgi:FKBP-type peptidyl-prolyl cis-trans isomerase FkpA